MNLFRRVVRGKTADTYTCRVQIGGKDVWKDTGQTTLEAAQQWAKRYVEPLLAQTTAEGLAATIRDLRAGRQAIPLADALRRFRAMPHRQHRGPRREAQIDSIWADFQSWAFSRGLRSLQDVRPEDTVAYAGHLGQEGRYRRSVPNRSGAAEYDNPSTAWSARTFNCHRDTLHQVFAALADASGVRDNPWDAVPRRRKDTVARQTFTDAELAGILATGDAWARPLLWLGAHTGLRLGDCATLRWREVDLDRGWIHRRQSKTGGEVSIPLLPELREMLASLPRDGEDVLPDQAATYRHDPNRVSARVLSAIRQAVPAPAVDVGRSRRPPTLDFHSLRHTWCSRAVAAGVPLSVVQHVAGHATAEMTMRYASHVTPDDARAALLRLSDPNAPTLASLLDSMTAKTWRTVRDEIRRRFC
jgi:integrase